MRKSALVAAGTQFRKEGISKRVQDIMVSPIKEMRMIAAEYDNVISFGQGIPYLDTPKEIREKLSKIILEKDVSKYSISPGVMELRERLAKKLLEYGIKAEPKSEILVTNGAMEGIFTAVMTLVNAGDEVIMFTPGFSSHIEQVMLAGGTPVFSKLNSKDWSVNFDDLRSKITKKTKAIIVSNPNNPTGSVYKKDDLLKLSKLVLEHDLMVIADDPYNFLVYEGDYFSLSSLAEMKKNIISCFSFSKEYAMTGYRLGYVVAPSDVMSHMMKVHDACCICAPVISQYAGIIAVDIGHRASDQIKDALSKNRDIIVTGLSAIKGISFVKPNGAYYVLVKYDKKMDSVDLAIDILKKVQVEVVPGSAFGPSGEGHIRLSFGGKPENLKEGLARLKRYFEG
jgi:aminotransferase